MPTAPAETQPASTRTAFPLIEGCPSDAVWRRVAAFEVPGIAKAEAKKQGFFRRKGSDQLHPGARVDLDDRKAWKAVVQVKAAEYQGEPVRGPVLLSITVRGIRPASNPKNPTRSKPWPWAWLVRPDVNNFCKPIEDAMTGIVWVDDSQVVGEQVVKEYGERAEVRVQVWACDLPEKLREATAQTAAVPAKGEPEPREAVNDSESLGHQAKEQAA